MGETSALFVKNPMSETSARDYLANERTFLAWVRTSIALTSFGVVIAKLRFLLLGAGGGNAPGGSHAGTHSTALGLAFAGVGVLTLLFAAFHYARVRRSLERGDYRSAPFPIYIFVAIIFLLGLAAIAYLLTLSPR